jgi:hypothetical protein
MTRLGRSHAGILKVTAGPEVVTADSVHRRPLQPVTGDVSVLPACRASRDGWEPIDIRVAWSAGARCPLTTGAVGPRG